MSIYLDYNASSPIDSRVLDVMMDVYRNHVGNSDSRTHNYGEQARSIVEHARTQVAKLLDIPSEDVFFTSGATESNNIALQGLKEYAEKTGKRHMIATAIEHKAILETAKSMEKKGFSVDYVFPEPSGEVDAEKILKLVRDDTLIVSMMHVNNETGIIQPVKEVGDVLNENGTLFHMDATQSCGKLVDELQIIQYDMMSFSAHKLYGPQGIGALILRRKNYKRPPVLPVMYGGQQEHGIRPGTIPAALVAGCGKACELAEAEYGFNNEQARQIKDGIVSMFDKSGLSYHINGDQEYCVPGTLNICIEGVSSEALMISTKQYCGISNGSACTSRSYSPSYVLSAMGIAEDQINSSVRISWGHGANKEEIFSGLQGLINVAKQMK